MIITLSGVDCAGKSTHIELIKQYFISQGKTCTVFWYRPGYSHEIQNIKKVIRKAAAAGHRVKQIAAPKKAEISHETAVATQITVPPPIWLTTAITDSFLQWAIKLRILERKYDVVICDRYIQDACLDLTFKYPDVMWGEAIFKALSLSFPKPDCQLLLWLPHETMLNRAEAKQEPFPDSPEVRDLRWHAYDHLSRMQRLEGFHVIDASGTIEETHAAIRAAITKP